MSRLPTVPVVLLTDFGPHSAYVGQMKLVLEDAAPGVRVLDLAHDLPAQNIAAAICVLESALPLLPRNAVLVAVVDPGVGSDRRILAAKFKRGVRVLAPDNGIMDAIAALEAPLEFRTVSNRALWRHPVSPVFHGRDIFAPVAGWLVRGGKLSAVGPLYPKASLVQTPRFDAVCHKDGRISGVRVALQDSFGNLITNLSQRQLPKGARLEVRLGRRKARFVEHYAQGPRGRLLALWGSFGRLELAVREASAAELFRAGEGTSVSVRIVRGR